MNIMRIPVQIFENIMRIPGLSGVSETSLSHTSEAIILIHQEMRLSW